MKKFTPSQDHADRIVAIITKWSDIPKERPKLTIVKAKRYTTFAEVKGVPPWAYEQLINHFLTVVRDRNERH